MVDARLTPRRMRSLWSAAAPVWVLGCCSLAGCAATARDAAKAAPGPPASPRSAAKQVSPAPPDVPQPPSFAGPSRQITALGQGLVFPLPDVKGWRRNKAEKQSWVAEHAATSSSFVVRVWAHDRVARPADCEERARLWRRDLPQLSAAEIVEARERLLAGTYAGPVLVGVRNQAAASGSQLWGHVLAFASDARSCLLLSFSTAASGPGAARAIAERLGVMSKVFDRVRRVGIDDRVDVPRL